MLMTCFTLFGEDSSSKETSSLFDGRIYSRFAVSYQHADDYHSGFNSAASSIFDDNDGEYTFINYSFDLVYILKNGFYIGTGAYASEAEVKTDGLGAGVPNTDSNLEIREIPLAIGYDMPIDDWLIRFEARYKFNVDDDFNRNNALASAVVLPATDGSDSMTFTTRVRRDFFGFEHALLVGYQMFENDVEHPIYPSFSLGDRVFIDYAVSKVLGDVKLSVGHLYSQSERTKGTPSAATGTAYLTEKPLYSELRATATYRITSRLLLDGGVKYTYSGKDAPKQKSVYLGLAYVF